MRLSIIDGSLEEAAYGTVDFQSLYDNQPVLKAELQLRRRIGIDGEVYSDLGEVIKPISLPESGEQK